MTSALLAPNPLDDRWWTCPDWCSGDPNWCVGGDNDGRWRTHQRRIVKFTAEHEIDGTNQPVEIIVQRLDQPTITGPDQIALTVGGTTVVLDAARRRDLGAALVQADRLVRHRH